MKRLNSFFIICLTFGVFFSLSQKASSEIVPGVVTLHEANDAIDYNWYTYVPKSLDKEKLSYILMGGENSYAFYDYNQLTEDVRQFIEHSTTDAERHGYVLLRPVIPRKENVYTGAFDRNSFLSSTDPFYQRCDQRVNLMIEHLINMLKASGYKVFEKVFIEGFSLGGMFAQRYCLLHPERVQAIAAGQCGGSLTVPEKNYNGTDMNWPVGINDFESLVGKDFNRAEYLKVPQFLYIGDEDDTNSTVYHNSELFTDKQITFLNGTFGDTDPVRIQNQSTYMKNIGCNLEFKLYPDVGHTTTPESDKEVFAFLNKHKFLNIKANNEYNSLFTLPNNPISIKIGSSPSSLSGQNADWWIYADTPFGWYSYVYPIGWLAGINRCIQYPLFEFDSFEVLNMGLPNGDYTFYYAVDNNDDGVMDTTWQDSVKITVRNVTLDFGFDIPKAKINVDGSSNDWANIDPVKTDLQNDSSCGIGTDLKNLYLATDESNLYWRIDTWSGNYKFEEGDNKFGPVLHFHTQSNENSINVSMVGYRDQAWISTKDGSSDWVTYGGGPEYGKANEIAEGSIPLSLFADMVFNDFGVLLYKTTTSNSCDEF